MNYQKHYDLLIERAKTRILEGYTERHHIIPKCMGGSNKKDNLVKLTPEEHYVAHQLLVKMHPNHSGLVYAAIAMSMSNNRMIEYRNNKLYGWIRKRAAEIPKSAETKAKMSLAKLGRKFTLEHRANMSKSQLERLRSETYRKRMREVNFKVTQSQKWKDANKKANIEKAKDPVWLEKNRIAAQNPERRAKISKAMGGRKHTPEHIAKRVAGRKRNAMIRKQANTLEKLMI